jgi:hypothetical protein
MAHFAPAIEDEVSADALHELETELAELTEAANADGVPQELRAFIIRQADKIRRALRRYRIEGIEPLKEAVSAGIGDLHLAREVRCRSGVPQSHFRCVKSGSPLNPSEASTPARSPGSAARCAVHS